MRQVWNVEIISKYFLRSFSDIIEACIVVLCEYFMNDVIAFELMESFVYIVNSTGYKTDPCAMTVFVLIVSDLCSPPAVFITTTCSRRVKNSRAHKMKILSFLSYILIYLIYFNPFRANDAKSVCRSLYVFKVYYNCVAKKYRNRIISSLIL